MTCRRFLQTFVLCILVLGLFLSSALAADSDIKVARGQTLTELMDVKQVLYRKGYYRSDFDQNVLGSNELDDWTMNALLNLSKEYPGEPDYFNEQGLTNKAFWDLLNNPGIRSLATPPPDVAPEPVYRDIRADDPSASQAILDVQDRLRDFGYLNMSDPEYKAGNLTPALFRALKNFTEKNHRSDLYNDDMISARLQEELIFLPDDMIVTNKKSFAEKLHEYFSGSVSIGGLRVPMLVLWCIGLVLVVACVVAVVMLFGPAETPASPEKAGLEAPSKPLKKAPSKKTLHFEITYQGNTIKHDQAIEDMLKIGRDVGNFPINSEDTEISRRHCELYYHGKNLMLRDYSRYGTGHDGKIINNRQCQLKNGDVFTIGQHSIKVSW